jgi:hypothetical protein
MIQRSPIAIVLALALTLLAACGGGVGADSSSAPAVGGAVCPPCRMAVLAHYEVIQAEGLRFGVCNPRCAEIIRKDPTRFAKDALP